MPRRNRCLVPEMPCHITQRGVDRREVFSGELDRITSLRLLQENLNDAAVRILGFVLGKINSTVQADPFPFFPLGPQKFFDVRFPDRKAETLDWNHFTLHHAG